MKNGKNFPNHNIQAYKNILKKYMLVWNEKIVKRKTLRNYHGVVFLQYQVLGYMRPFLHDMGSLQAFF